MMLGDWDFVLCLIDEVDSEGWMLGLNDWYEIVYVELLFDAMEVLSVDHELSEWIWVWFVAILCE